MVIKCEFANVSSQTVSLSLSSIEPLPKSAEAKLVNASEIPWLIAEHNEEFKRNNALEALPAGMMFASSAGGNSGVAPAIALVMIATSQSIKKNISPKGGVPEVEIPATTSFAQIGSGEKFETHVAVTLNNKGFADALKICQSGVSCREVSITLTARRLRQR